MPVTVKASALSFAAKVEGGKLLIETEAGFLTPEQAGVVIDNSGGGEGGGTSSEITAIAEGADPVMGKRSDLAVTDPSVAATQMAVGKGQLKSLNDLIVEMRALTAALGSASGSSGKAMRIGGKYRGTLTNLADNAEQEVALDLSGNVRTRLVATSAAAADDMPAFAGWLSGPSDSGGGGQRPLAGVWYGHDDSTNKQQRVRMNGKKSLYVSVAPADTASGTTTAQTINAITLATANLIGQIDNPGHRYKRAIIHVKNLTDNALNDLILRTKCNPTDPAFDLTINGATAWAAKGTYPLLSVIGQAPATLSDGEVRIELDISSVTSLEIRATVPSATPGTTASLRYYLISDV